MIYVAMQPASERGPRPDRGETISRSFAAIQAGDSAVLHELLTPDAITRWPQSSERITGAMACVQVHANYPGGPPTHRVQRITGDGNTWVAELTADYGDERGHIVSVIEFDGSRIGRMTDYFGPTSPAPEWRRAWVELEDAVRPPFPQRSRRVQTSGSPRDRSTGAAPRAGSARRGPR